MEIDVENRFSFTMNLSQTRTKIVVENKELRSPDHQTLYEYGYGYRIYIYIVYSMMHDR